MKNFSIFDTKSPKRKGLMPSAPNRQASPNTLIELAPDDLSAHRGTGPDESSDVHRPHANIWDDFQDFTTNLSSAIPIDHNLQEMTLPNNLHHESLYWRNSDDIIPGFC